MTVFIHDMGWQGAVIVLADSLSEAIEKIQSASFDNDGDCKIGELSQSEIEDIIELKPGTFHITNGVA